MPRILQGPFVTGIDPHAHFNTWAANPNTVAAWSLRDPDHLLQPPTGIGGVDPSLWEIDPVIDAAKLTLSEARWAASAHPNGGDNGISVDTPRLLRAEFPPIGFATGDTIASFQIEIRQSDFYNNANASAIGWNNGALKLLQIGDDTGGKYIELLTQTGVDCPGVLQYRYYRPVGDILEPFAADNNPIRLEDPGAPDGNRQPGGVTAAFDNDRPFSVVDHLAMLAGNTNLPALIEPNKWLRLTYWIDIINATQIRLRVYVAGEDFDPVLFFDSIATPGLGMLLDNPDEASARFRRFDFEHNSSQPGSFLASLLEALSWCRNLLIAKNVYIDLGGRPIAA